MTIRRRTVAAVAIAVTACAGWAGTASAEEACVLGGSDVADVCTNSSSTSYPLSPYQVRYESHETVTVTVAGFDAVVVDQTCYLETNGAYPITGTEWDVTVAGVSAPTIEDGGPIFSPISISTEPWYLYRQSPTCGKIAP